MNKKELKVEGDILVRVEENNVAIDDTTEGYCFDFNPQQFEKICRWYLAQTKENRDLEERLNSLEGRIEQLEKAIQGGMWTYEANGKEIVSGPMASACGTIIIGGTGITSGEEVTIDA
jgi:hypothetical protein